MQSKSTSCSPKNLGRSNETSAEDQASKEFKSKITKQMDKGYRLTEDDALGIEELLPMLASNGSVKPHLIKFPSDVSVKLDGVRCLVTIEGDEVKFKSRGGKDYFVPDYLKEELLATSKGLNLTRLDGELYFHGTPLQDIVSYVKKYSDDNPRIQFYIFDIPEEGPTWITRNETIKLIGNFIKDKDLKHLVMVPSLLCHGPQDMEDFLTVAEEAGYEGIMLRNLDGKYQYNHRSNDLIKVKNMLDSEARVVSVAEDKNQHGVLTCDWKGISFKCKMLGDNETRSYDNQLKLVGQYIKFKYQQVSKDGVPIFPVGLSVREVNEAGEPIE